jgi:UDP-glucose 4-epimerase
MHYAYLIAFRARPPQEFRRAELDGLIENIRQLHAANPQHTYRIWVIEQGNDRLFNRGWLLNAAFAEAVRENPDAVFVHCNSDYRLPVGPMPESMQQMPEGVHDVHGYEPALGAYCLFTADAYRRCNGFPNDLWGWGGDDIAIWKRLQLAGVPVSRDESIYNRWVQEDKNHLRDQSANNANIQLGLSVTAETLHDNGLTTVRYWIAGQREEPDLSWRTIDEPRRFIVTGGAGFIGSHMTDELCRTGNAVTVIDNLRSGFREQVNPAATLVEADIRSVNNLTSVFASCDGVFHFAAIARTPWCIDDPILCYETNVLGTLNVCEASRRAGVSRTVLSSSNVVYAFMTPYRTSKEAGEAIGTAYHDMYGQSVISLRYSNVYGPRQSETGPSPNVFAALRKTRRDEGKLYITGNGEQTRDFTHVSDIVQGNLAAMRSDYCGVVDLCTGNNWSLNTIAEWFGGEVVYGPERPGDVKHIVQDPSSAHEILGWRARVSLPDGIKDVLP